MNGMEWNQRLQEKCRAIERRKGTEKWSEEPNVWVPPSNFFGKKKLGL